MGAVIMTKGELVELLFEQGTLGDTRVGVERAVEAVLNGIARGLKRVKKVQITGFGAFEVRKRRARMGRNPQTGERLEIAASKTVAFKPAPRLRELCD
jgi:nucleoid DNA-binding protein